MFIVYLYVRNKFERIFLVVCFFRIVLEVFLVIFKEGMGEDEGNLDSFGIFLVIWRKKKGVDLYIVEFYRNLEF